MEAFRGQPDALQQAAASKHPRQPQPHADGAGGLGKKGGAERPQPAVEATRQRDLQQGAITADPARLESGRRAVRAAVIAEHGERDDPALGRESRWEREWQNVWNRGGGGVLK